MSDDEPMKPINSLTDAQLRDALEKLKTGEKITFTGTFQTEPPEVWIAELFFCVICNHRWAEVYPEGFTNHECSECGFVNSSERE